MIGGIFEHYLRRVFVVAAPDQGLYQLVVFICLFLAACARFGNDPAHAADPGTSGRPGQGRLPDSSTLLVTLGTSAEESGRCNAGVAQMQHAHQQLHQLIDFDQVADWNRCDQGVTEA